MADATTAHEARQSTTVPAGEARIETYVQGAGPTFVVLPSYGRDGGDDFDDLSARLAADGWRVLRPQPRGVAGSTGPMTGITQHDLAADVAAAVRALGDGPAVVLGHAFGDSVARMLAVDSPDLVSAVVVAAAAASGADIAPDVGRTPFVAGDPSAPEEERLGALRRAFFAPGHDPRPWLTGWYPATLAAEKAALGAVDESAWWGAGSVPLLEVVPAQDPFKPEATWHQMRHQLGSRVTTVVVEGAAHALFPEQPDAVADAVLPWAARVRGT